MRKFLSFPNTAPRYRELANEERADVSGACVELLHAEDGVEVPDLWEIGRDYFGDGKALYLWARIHCNGQRRPCVVLDRNLPAHRSMWVEDTGGWQWISIPYVLR